MFKIGQFSKLTKVSARMLRYYDKYGLFKPVETDHFTGYRLYSARQIPLLNRIIALRDAGFSVEEIRSLLDHGGDEAYIQQALDNKSKQLQDAIQTEQQKLSFLEYLRTELRKEHYTMHYEVEIKQIKPVLTAALREVVADYSKEDLLWEKLYDCCKNEGIKVGSGEIYSIYYDSEEKEQDVDMKAAIVLDADTAYPDSTLIQTLEEIPCAAVVTYTGGYGNIGGAMSSLAVWIEENGYQIIGTMRGKGILHPGNESDPENYKTEIQVPIAKIL